MVLFIYHCHIDKIEYCKWLYREIKLTYKVKHDNIRHRLSNIDIMYDNTIILIKFNKNFKTTNEDYFNYKLSRPSMKIVMDEDVYNEHKKKYLLQFYLNKYYQFYK